MNRPAGKEIFTAPSDILVVFSALFTVGLMLASLLPSGMHTAMLTAAIGCLLLSYPESLVRWRTIFLALAALSSAAFYGNLLMVMPADYSHFLALDGSTGTISGQFKGELNMKSSGSIRFKMADTRFESNEQRVSIPGLVDCALNHPEIIPEPEQSYSLTGRFSIGSPGYPPAFHADSITNVSSNLSPKSMTGRIQRQLRDGLSTVLPPRHAGIVTGLILGDTSQLTREDKALFRETGISHILAVSGQHIMVLIMFLAAILHWLKIPPLSRSIMIGVFLLLYSMTTVGSPSVWRAFIMYLCVAIVLHIEAYPSPVRPVAIAAFLLLLIDPQLISNAAFQLSFAAVISIVFLRGPLEDALKRCFFPKIFARYLAISMAASFGTMPLSAFLFGTVSTSALLVNPLIVWSFSYILPVAFITAFLAIFWPAAAILVAPGLSLVLDGMLFILGKFQAIPGQYFFVGNLPGVLIAAIYAGMLYAIARYNQSQILAGQSATEPESKPCAVTTESTQPVVEKTNNEKIVPREPQQADSITRRPPNPFKHGPTLTAMDEMLCECRRKPLKNLKAKVDDSVPLHLFSIESQNLYHLMSDLDRDAFNAEPERLLQSHIFLMALAGNEILNRVSAHLNPPPQPGEIRIHQAVRERNLATAILAETVMHSSLLTRSRSDDFMMLISRGQSAFLRARRQLERILANENFAESIEQHYTLRQDMLRWCSEFIDYDNRFRQQQNTKLRPEQ